MYKDQHLVARQAWVRYASINDAISVIKQKRTVVLWQKQMSSLLFESYQFIYMTALLGMKESFGEKCSVPQLLKAFYDRQQREGKTLHALRRESYKLRLKRNETKPRGQDRALQDRLAKKRSPSLEGTQEIHQNTPGSFLSRYQRGSHWLG